MERRIGRILFGGLPGTVSGGPAVQRQTGIPVGRKLIFLSLGVHASPFNASLSQRTHPARAKDDSPLHFGGESDHGEPVKQQHLAEVHLPNQSQGTPQKLPLRSAGL